jgi:hypothetical protein
MVLLAVWSGFIWDTNRIQQEITFELNCRTGAGTAGWAWNWIDGTSATLATAQHSYLITLVLPLFVSMLEPGLSLNLSFFFFNYFVHESSQMYFTPGSHTAQVTRERCEHLMLGAVQAGGT